MRTLDLFSGIGGFAVALRSVTKVAAYCEIDAACRSVLEANIRLGHLHAAPILGDVTKVSAAQVAALKPDLVTAGFPCQDISCASRNPLGLSGPRSRLFFEVIRLARAAPSVRHLLLENSACIRTRGLPQVLDALREAGFSSVAHGVFAASEVGALHARKRWFCLASKAPAGLPALHGAGGWAAGESAGESAGGMWRRKEPVPRLTGKHRSAKVRCGVLGNAVVPQCVRWAYEQLRTIMLQHPGEVTPRHPPKHVDHPPKHVDQKAAKKIVLDDGRGTVVHKDGWSTPVHSVWAQYRNLTNRSTRVLSNQVFYERGTKAARGVPISERSLHYDINPTWVEWLMGYPPGWTAAAAPPPAPAPTPPSRGTRPRPGSSGRSLPSGGGCRAA
jgi:hypothetical protein